VKSWPQLLPLLCTDAATPLLLRLQSLALPQNWGGINTDREHDAFLCRLSSLPAPPALQRFTAASVTYRAAGLLSIFSLPHLTQLILPGDLRHTVLHSFISRFTSAPAPLFSLVFPSIYL
jgi:hypothetical protein